MARRVKGAILIGVLASDGRWRSSSRRSSTPARRRAPTRKGWNLGYPALPDQVIGLPDLSLVGDVSFGAWTRLPVITVLLLVFTLVLADFFDAMGTMTGLGKEAGLLTEDGQLPKVGRALFVEGLAGAAGGAGSASSNTVFIESASGIAEGARTGLANIVTGVLFLAAMFLTPLYRWCRSRRPRRRWSWSAR